MKDYYYILGIKRTANKDEIKTAYRKLSNKFHPDKNNADDFFEERFKEINEAYRILIDDQSRNNYDEKKRRDPNISYTNNDTSSSKDISKRGNIKVNFRFKNRNVFIIFIFLSINLFFYRFYEKEYKVNSNITDAEKLTILLDFPVSYNNLTDAYGIVLSNIQNGNGLKLLDEYRNGGIFDADIETSLQFIYCVEARCALKKYKINILLVELDKFKSSKMVVKIDPDKDSEIANFFYNPEYTLHDFYTTIPIFPYNNGTYDIYCATNNERKPFNFIGTAEELSKIKAYKFSSYETCLMWCDWIELMKLPKGELTEDDL